MFSKFQLLFLKLISENSAGVGGVFGGVDAYSPENIDNVDTKVSMSIAGSKISKKKKKLKSKKPLVIRRTFPKGL
jgi:hypothetical protein